MKYLRRLVAVICGIFIAIAITTIIAIMGIFYIAPLVLLCISADKISAFASGGDVTLTTGQRDALEVAFLSVFGGIAYGYGYITERWNA